MRILKKSSFLLAVLCSLCAPQSSFGALTNFESMAQDFVLETKQIRIPGYDTAFNPSIIRWNGSILMCFRVRDPITLLTHQVGFVRLDDDFNLISEPQLLDIRFDNPYHPAKLQDPKLVICNGHLFMVYNNVVGPLETEFRRMFLAELHEVNGHIHMHHQTAILNFDGVGRQPREKNWEPFVYKNSIYLADTIIPHRIQFPIIGTNSSKTIAETSAKVNWYWGQIRGGTQAFPIGDEYLSFFHSSKDMRSAHSPKDKITHYFMGAYTFSRKPPFEITQISPEPIFADNFYHGPEYKTWKPLKVVFPGGFIFDDRYIWVAYGKQDHEVWVVKLDKKGLLNSLVPVENEK